MNNIIYIYIYIVLKDLQMKDFIRQRDMNLLDLLLVEKVER